MYHVRSLVTNIETIKNQFQDVDDKDVILDSDVEDEQDESDDGEELVLKNQPQHFDEDSGMLEKRWLMK